MIKFSNVFKGFGGRTVLEDISFLIPDNKITVIMGPSGCGKSTVLRLMIGLMRPDSGTIEIMGNDITKVSDKELFEIRKNMGMVFQAGALFDSLNVIDNVSFFLKEHKLKSKEEIASLSFEALKFVGLEDSAYLYPSELSGGMQRRVAIARTIVYRPKIVLFDEPTTGLDPHTSRIIEDLIRNLREQTGALILIVSHVFQTAFRLAERIIYLDNKKILFDGDPKDFVELDNTFVNTFLGPEGKKIFFNYNN
ncbi:Phosphonate-transporting ATPase [Thermodesulfobium narugense DSM 14796]|uniref:Phosphonate-transporting ATPase n=1 Tax=Thermodesulfobium narugense DSM 14796 TaxID=747365 RepID=M1E791_9BACT|nr:ATP-binding cassette domain-containing protein [Thermodesulfobium narugense]AEE13874.1 Phosphonate-transporting ATPase [Thermodesulfobium narugense DSM 14796]